MNRELKFRVWDKFDERMSQANMEWYDDMFAFRFNHRGFEEEDNSDVIIMQWTGLKDKNGVDIYEGDVVKVNIDEVGSVFFSNGTFWVGFYNEPAKQCISEFTKYNFDTDAYDIVEIEIIGKIAQIKKK